MSFAIVARIRVKEQFKDSLIEKLRVHAQLSDEEPGCLAFSVAQSNDDPLEFFFFELYKNAEAFDEHKSYERVQAHIKSVAPWLEEGSWSKRLTKLS